MDGCRGGWVVSSAEFGGGIVLSPEIRFERSFEAAVSGVDLALVDVPIGLLTCAVRGGRVCDRSARGMLGRRSSSVFSPPVRMALYAESYEQANWLSRNSSAEGLGISVQSWNIAPKISEVDGWITPERQARVRECHPEVVFAVLNRRRTGGADGPSASKKTVAGRRERLELLRFAGVEVSADVNDLIRVRGANADDIIDSLACLASAGRVARGRAEVFGGEKDARGLRMEIVA